MSNKVMIYEQIHTLTEEMNSMYNDLGKIDINYRMKHNGKCSIISHAKVICEKSHTLSGWLELERHGIIHFLYHLMENHCMGVEDANLSRYFVMDDCTALLPISMLNPTET